MHMKNFWYFWKFNNEGVFRENAPRKISHRSQSTINFGRRIKESWHFGDKKFFFLVRRENWNLFVAVKTERDFQLFAASERQQNRENFAIGRKNVLVVPEKKFQIFTNLGSDRVLPGLVQLKQILGPTTITKNFLEKIFKCFSISDRIWIYIY